MSASVSSQASQNRLVDCSQAVRLTNKPFVSIALRTSRRVGRAARCQAPAAPGTDSSRRQALQLGSASLAAAWLTQLNPGPALAAKTGGYVPIKDPQDGYQFLAPFGWQEVSVKGQDVVYKDIIEPLESVSVSMTPTDKTDISEFGSPAEIAFTLANKVLTPPKQEVKILNVSERESEGRKYVEFEFASKAPTYIRHALASVTVANGKFYTLATGSNDNRWSKMEDRLKQVLNSFIVQERFPTS